MRGVVAKEGMQRDTQCHWCTTIFIETELGVF